MATQLNLDLLTDMGFAAGRGGTERHGRGDPGRRRRSTWVPRWPAPTAPWRGTGRATPGSARGAAADHGLAARRTPGGRRTRVGARTVCVRRGDGRARGRLSRAGVQRQRDGRAGGAAQATPLGAVLLVMGPDCGTAVVGGVGLGFANAVRLARWGSSPRAGPARSSSCALLDTPGWGSPLPGRRRAGPVPRSAGGYPRGDAAAGRRPGHRADRGGVQAPAPRSRAEIRRTPRRCPPRSSWRCSGPGTRTYRGDRDAAPGAPASGAGVAGRGTAAAPPAELLRGLFVGRHAVRRGDDRRRGAGGGRRGPHVGRLRRRRLTPAARTR